jgi:hypothetical protein
VTSRSCYALYSHALTGLPAWISMILHQVGLGLGVIHPCNVGSEQRNTSWGCAQGSPGPVWTCLCCQTSSKGIQYMYILTKIAPSVLGLPSGPGGNIQ